MNTTPPSPQGRSPRQAQAVKLARRAGVALALLSLGNQYVPVIDGVTAATQVVSSPPTLTLIWNGQDIGTAGNFTITEGQSLTVVAQAGDVYGYPVQISYVSGRPAGVQVGSSNYGINPQLVFSWTPPAGIAAASPVNKFTFTAYNYFNSLSTAKSFVVNVTAWKPSSTNINCLFNWAERTYPSLFYPTGFQTAASGVYSYRWYSGTNSYLGVSSADNHVYFLGPDGSLHDEGSIQSWLPKIGC